MKFFYQSGAMGFFGEGYWYHRFFRFPKLEVVSKTITLDSKRGHPYSILHLGTSIWNRIGLHNRGLAWWIINNPENNIILSIAGTDQEIERMIEFTENIDLKGIELNYSCPNIESYNNRRIPKSKHRLYLKLNHLQNPYQYDLSDIKSIRLNSIPKWRGGVSGRLAQKYNWGFIKKYKELPIAGASWTSTEDLKRIEDMGCKECGIGSIMLINPWLIKQLPKDFITDN